MIQQAAPFVWGNGGEQLTPEEIARRRVVAQSMMQQGGDYSPVQHWTQGAARVTQALLGASMARDANEADKANRAADQALIANMIAGGTATPASAPVSAPAGNPAAAIASIESRGQENPYGTLGPVTKTGDRAYGKYQVMGANIPAWTKAHLGQEMTPEQFVASPQAQDAVFKGQFGQYANKYGPEGAARAWFAGEGGMDDPSRKDQLGTSVADYSRKFTTAMGPQVAQIAPTPTSPFAKVNPQAISVMSSPYASDAAKKIAGLIVQQQLKRDDYDIQQRPDGSVIAVNKKDPADMRVLNAPGAGASAIKFEADKAAAIATAKGEAEKKVGQATRDEQAKSAATVVTQDIDRALDLIDKAQLPTTGATGAFLSNIGGTAARDVRGLVDTVKANAGFAELQKMRNNSPTGGALGQVSEREIAYLQATIGNLEQSQSKEQVQDNLRRVKNAYLDIIHGPGSGPREALKFQSQTKSAPAAGVVEQGYRFKGGDPSKPESWEKVQ